MHSPLDRPHARPADRDRIDHGIITQIDAGRCWWQSDSGGTERGPALLPLGLPAPPINARVVVLVAGAGDSRLAYATPYPGDA